MHMCYECKDNFPFLLLSIKLVFVQVSPVLASAEKVQMAGTIHCYFLTFMEENRNLSGVGIHNCQSFWEVRHIFGAVLPTVQVTPSVLV